MNHEVCVREMYQSLTLAGVLTTIIFAFVHTLFSTAAEVIGFYMGTQMVLTYAVWTLISLVKKV